jgi:hypothetical protein
MAAMDADAGSHRADMRAGPNTVIAHARANTDRVAGMRPGINSVTTDACAGADRTHMGAGSNAVFADMCADPHAQHIDPCSHIRKGGGGCEQGERKQ